MYVWNLALEAVSQLLFSRGQASSPQRWQDRAETMWKTADEILLDGRLCKFVAL